MRLGEDGSGNRIFLQRIQNVKKREKKKFLFSVLGRGTGGKWVFFTKNRNLHIFFGPGGMEGVVWRGGSVARVDVNSFYK